MITRRGILLGGLAFAAVASFGLLGADIVAKSEIVSLVRQRLRFLKLDEAGLQSFAKDHIATVVGKRPTWNRVKYHFRLMFAKRGGVSYGFSSDKRTRKERMADSLATTYLLSSDFFVNGADESSVVQYVSHYDYLRPCNNPFARPPVDTAKTG